MGHRKQEHERLLRYVSLGDWVILAGLLYVLGLIVVRTIT
jgi:hypothetical protein